MKQQESEPTSACLKRWKPEENILHDGLCLWANVWDLLFKIFFEYTEQVTKTYIFIIL